MSLRTSPVVEFPERPEPGPVRRALDILQAVLGRMTAFADVLLLYSQTGITVTNAASGAGTAVEGSRVLLSFADAGADQIRVVARGNNSTAGSVTVQCYDVTNNRALCAVTVTGTSLVTVAGDYAPTRATGGEHEVELRVIGDGAMDPVLRRVSIQLRTLQMRA